MNSIIYQTTPPLPPLCFEYPDAWKFVQGSGKGYKEISLLGPRNLDDNFTLAMVIRFTPLADENISLNTIANNYIERRKKLTGFMIRSENKSIIKNVEANIIEISFSSPKSFDMPKSEMMEIYEQRTLFILTGVLVEFIFTGTEDVFFAAEEEAEKIISSIR